MRLRIIKIILISILCLPLPKFAVAQDSTNCFTDEEIHNMYEYTRSLEISDSLKTIQIDLQKQQIHDYKTVTQQDSSLLKLKDQRLEIKDQEIDLYKRYANLYKPKWYENKHLWFFMGTGTTLLTGWMINKIN